MNSSIVTELCREVRSTDDVSFNLLKIALFFVLISMGLLIYSENKFVDIIFLIFAGFTNTILVLWEIRNQQVCCNSIRQVKIMMKRHFKEEMEIEGLYPNLSDVKIAFIPVRKSFLIKVLFFVFSMWWLGLSFFIFRAGNFAIVPIFLNSLNCLVCLYVIFRKNLY